MDDWKLKARPVVRLERPKKKFVLNIWSIELNLNISTRNNTKICRYWCRPMFIYFK